jgi:Uma2 family endonuclease
VIKRLERGCTGLEAHGCHLRVQQPITLLPDKEPEPDGAVVRGSEDNYRDRHPGPAEILCLIEVADSSLQFDRITKQRIYADAGIALYVIVDLMHGAVEVYREPQIGGGRYAKTETLRRGDRLHLELPDGALFELLVDVILP